MGMICKNILKILWIIIALIFILNIKLYATTVAEDDLLKPANIIKESEILLEENKISETDENYEEGETFKESENIVISSEDDLGVDTNSTSTINATTSDSSTESNSESKNTIWTTKSKAIVISMNVILTAFFIYRIKRCMENRKIINEKYIRKYTVKEFKYFKDIPNEENATPGRAMFWTQGQITGDIFFATLLDLSLKGLVGFEVIKKDDFKIFVFNRKDIVLSRDEQIIYDLLNDAIYASENDYVTISELDSYVYKNGKNLWYEFGEIRRRISEDETLSGNIVEENMKLRDKLSTECAIYMFLAAVFGPFIIVPLISIKLIFAAIPLIFPIPYVCMIICMYALEKTSKKIEILSQSGRQEEICWKGLKRYLEEYTLVNNDIPKDVNLLEKYLVYATAFGISNSLINQLQIANFDIQNIKKEETLITNGKTNVNLGFWHLITNENFGIKGFLKVTGRLRYMYDERLTIGGEYER